MNLSPGYLIGNLLVSGVGWVVFYNYGYKKMRPLFMVFGGAMMAVPYIVSGFLPMVGTGAVLCGILFWLSKGS